jgi:nitrous oxide reductase
MSDHPRRAKARFSRRKVLTTTAVVGVGAAAVSVTGLSLANDRRETAASAAGGQLVVHVRDVKAGTLDIFLGTNRIQVRDKDLAARLAVAARG